MRPRTLVRYSVFLGLLAFLGAALVYPIFLTVRGGFADDIVTGEGFTLRHVANVFRDPLLREGLLNSFSIALVATLVSVVISLPLAVLAANHTYPLKGLWNATILVPLILPPFLGAIGFRAILGRYGALNSLLGTEYDYLGSAKFWGVIASEALHLYPIIYLNATAALANLDPALDEAAENVGAGRLRRFLLVTLPLIRPGLFAGGTVVFIWAFTELGSPLMFDFYAVTPVQIFNGLKEVQSSAQPYALTVVMLVFAVLLYVVGRVVFGGEGHAMYSKAARASSESPLGPIGGWLASAGFALVAFLALVPHIGVVLSSFAVDGSWYRSVLPRAFTMGHYEQALGHPLAFGSILMSLKLSSAAMVVDVLLGILIGYVIVRTKVRGRSLLDSLSMLPLAVPGLVMAFGYVALSLRWPFAGDHAPLAGMVDIIGADPNPIPLLVLVYAVRRLPPIVRSTVAGLSQTSGELEEAAVNLGASTLRAVRSVVIPLIMANVIAGALLVFSFSMLGVSDALILAQQEKSYPMTKAIYAFAERLGDGAGIASAMGVWAMALLTVTLAGSSIVMGRKLGAMFRV